MIFIFNFVAFLHGISLYVLGGSLLLTVLFSLLYLKVGNFHNRKIAYIIAGLLFLMLVSGFVFFLPFLFGHNVMTIVMIVALSWIWGKSLYHYLATPASSDGEEAEKC